MTTLPNPTPCTVDPQFNIFTRVSFTMCGDLIFSAHASQGIAVTLIVTSFSKNRLLKAVMWIITIPYTFLVIASRLHYTVDVILAYYLSISVWLAFQTLDPIEGKTYGKQQPQQPTNTEMQKSASLDSITSV